VALDAVIGKIPGLRRLSIVPQKLEGRWKVLMSPGFVALIVGLTLSLGVGYSIVDALDFSVKFAAVFLLLPQVIWFLKEGFSPVSDATASFARRRIKDGREVYIGVNHLVVADNPSVIISTIVLIPIALLMGALIPWVRIFPMGDLMNIVSIIIVIVAVCRGNIVRSILISIPVVLLNLVLSTVVAPVYTQVAQRLSYDMGSVTGEFAASLNGSTYISVWVSDLLQGRLWALVTIPVVIAAGTLCYRYYKVSLSRLKEKNGANQQKADAIKEETT
jgi:PTS system galactitol-specific IIC component